jgi:hypothetical protein
MNRDIAGIKKPLGWHDRFEPDEVMAVGFR